MTIGILQKLQESHAFDPAPQPADLGVYHVPFDTMTQTRETEALLAASCRIPERVAVVGHSGSGKSSVISGVLGPLEEDVAPIRIPVAAEDREAIVTRVGFARHLVRTVARYAADAALMSEKDRGDAVVKTAPTEVIGGGAKVFALGLTPGWIVGNPELKAELTSTAEALAVKVSGAEVVDQAARVIEVVASAGLVPVLVVDDSDAWFNVPGSEDRLELATGFFEEVPRFIAESLMGGAVFAVHESYLNLRAFEEARGFVETLVRVPDAPGAPGIRSIVQRRLDVHQCGTTEDLFAEGIIDRLHAHYSGVAERNLRKTLLVCHTALRAAVTDGAQIINMGHVEKAIAES